MRRRSFLPLLAALLLAAPAAVAQEAPAGRADAPGAATAERPAEKPRRAARRRRVRPRPPVETAQPPPAPAPETEPRLEAAPVPNRNLEAPRGEVTSDRTRLSPSVIHKPLPNQGMAAEGAASIQEERLFFPAPGARLNVPFSY